MLRILIEAGADVDAAWEHDEKDEEDEDERCRLLLPLHCAVRGCHPVANVSLLLRANANPRLKCFGRGQTPLFDTVEYLDEKPKQMLHITYMLLKKGADMRVTDRSGESFVDKVLRWASRQNEDKKVAFLHWLHRLFEEDASLFVESAEVRPWYGKPKSSPSFALPCGSRSSKRDRERERESDDVDERSLCESLRTKLFCTCN